MSGKPAWDEIWKRAVRECREGNGNNPVHRTGPLEHQFTNLTATWDTISRLAPGNEANDMVINVWFRELVRWFTTGKTPLDHDVYVFDTQFYQTGHPGCLCHGTPTTVLMDHHTRKTVDKRGLLGLFGFDCIVVPMHVGSGTHWA